MNEPAIKPDKADLSRTRILDAAARLFREQGYAAVSLRAIAAAAGMKAGSVYYHFDSKQTIVIEILDAGIAAVHGEVERTFDALPPDASGDATVHACVLAHLKALFEYSDYTSANVRIYSQVPPAVRLANRRARRHYEALWEKILAHVADRGAVREVDPRIFRLMVIGSLNATLEWFDAKRGNLENLAAGYADIMLHGLLSADDSRAVNR